MLSRTLHLILLAATLLLAGCAAPGSTLTCTSIRGRLLDQKGKPLPNRKIEITLPAAYGLAGLDAMMGKPSHYGKSAQTAVLRTSRSGEFQHQFKPTTRSITYFLLPPLGPVPRTPPKPAYIISTDRHAYLVGWTRDGFQHRTQPIAGTRQSSLSSTPSVQGSAQVRDFTASNFPSFKGWETSLEIRE